MNRLLLFISAMSMMLVACQSISDRDTIARLRHMRIEIKEEKVDGGLEKAMTGYQRFLEETPDSALAPEAIRRLADLKIEKEYGTLTEGAGLSPRAPEGALPGPERVALPDGAAITNAAPERPAPLPAPGEADTDFEERATRSLPAADTGSAGGDDLDRASTREAIDLYMKLLNKYPLYERNDQVLYQASRAYEELGRTEEAMKVMDRLVREYPSSRYIDEVQFRRAEYFFMRRRYLDAEEAYTSIVNIGVGSSYYEFALYKLGWTYYKQELYEDALDRFIALLDHKVSEGYDFEQIQDEPERKRIEDTFRVISLSFSYLGGADSVVEYFAGRGKRSYEDSIYSHLGEFYFDKRRYADAAASYNAFVSRNPFHKAAPNFHMRVIEIHAAGGFPSLVLDSKKKFATTYGLKADYWKYFEPSARPDVLGHLKTNLTDLANHYHACYQDPRQVEEKKVNFHEALHWYREFLISFPADAESPRINYQLADLLLENRAFGDAAVEYEKTAYGYPPHERSAQAGYAAVYAHREHLRAASPEDQDAVKSEVVRSSLMFADAFPEHEKAAIVLGAAADDLYMMKEYERAMAAADKLIEAFPGTDVDVLRAAWVVVGHSSYELSLYSNAEAAYLKVLALLPEEDETRKGLIDNLAASIYKQGEEANSVGAYRTAADHFLRVRRVAPTSAIRPTAEYDAAAALIQLKDWETAAEVLVEFRNSFPGHALQPEVTKKIAYVYKESGRLSLAAGEYERIERESQDAEVRREALLVAAELYTEDGDNLRALEVYRRYVGYFPRPLELNIETRHKIAEILKDRDDQGSYLEELRGMVAMEASAGKDQTPRTRYLAGKAALVLAQQGYDEFTAVKLENPIEASLRRKRELMKSVTRTFESLMDYEIGEVTAAATFFLAEIYAHFSKALMTSEIPEGLSPLEEEQYRLAIEEQAYPFEEQAILIHENNLKLIPLGIYNDWVDRSLQRLAGFVPARYDKPEETGGIVDSPETYIFEIVGSAPDSENGPGVAGAGPAEPVQVEDTGSMEIKDAEPAGHEQAEGPDSVSSGESVAPLQIEDAGSVVDPAPAGPGKVQGPGSGSAPDSKNGDPAQVEKAGSVSAVEPGGSAQAEHIDSVTVVEPAEYEQIKEYGPGGGGNPRLDDDREVPPDTRPQGIERGAVLDGF